MKTKEEIIYDLIEELQSTSYEDLEYLADKAFEAGRNSMLPLLREAFNAGQDSIGAGDQGAYVLSYEAFEQFLKENNIEI